MKIVEIVPMYVGIYLKFVTFTISDTTVFLTFLQFTQEILNIDVLTYVY